MSAVAIYRIGNWAKKKNIGIIPLLSKLLIRLIYGSVIDPATHIGEGSYLAYGGVSVVIHKRAIIGNNVVIQQHVTIGGRSRKEGVPIIGNSVYIGAGAMLLGDITIGDNCVIGANAVVLSDLPPNTMAVGIPAKIIKKEIESNDYY